MPYRKGRYWYYARTEEGKQYPILARARSGRSTSAEEIVLDLNALARDHAYFAVDAFARQRRRQLPRVLRRHDRVPRVHRCASRTCAATRTDRSRSSASARPPGPPTATRSSTSPTTTPSGRYRLWRAPAGEEARSSSTKKPTSGSRCPSAARGASAISSWTPTATPASEVRFLAATDPTAHFRCSSPRARARVRDRSRRSTLLDPHQRPRIATTASRAAPSAPSEGARGRRCSRTARRVNLAGIERVRRAPRRLRARGRPGAVRRARAAWRRGPTRSRFPSRPYPTHSGHQRRVPTRRPFRFRYQSMVTPRSVYDYDMTTRERDAR